MILRKKVSEGKFELYTDVASSIDHYKKIRKMFKIAAIIEITCLFIEFFVGAVGGIMFGYAFALLIAAMLAGILNAVIKINNTIADLEGKMAGIETNHRKRNISAFLAMGLLMNSCALLIVDSVSHTITRTIQILAIIMMLIGLFQTCSRRK